jgi:hypothetical protein
MQLRTAEASGTAIGSSSLNDLANWPLGSHVTGFAENSSGTRWPRSGDCEGMAQSMRRATTDEGAGQHPAQPLPSVPPADDPAGQFSYRCTAGWPALRGPQPR